MKKLSFGILGLLLGGFLACPEAVQAMPALGNMETVKQPNGQVVEVGLRGDATFNYYMTKDNEVVREGNDGYWYYETERSFGKELLTMHKYGIDMRPLDAVDEEYVQAQAVQEKEAVTTFSAVEGRSAKKWSEQQNLLVVLVEFEDVPLSSTEDDWYEKFFGTEKSLATYFNEQTAGAMTVNPAEDTSGENNGIVTVKLDIPHPNRDGGMQDIMDKVLEKAAEHVDFAKYDTQLTVTDAIMADELHVMAIFAGREGSLGKLGTDVPSVWGHKSNFGEWSQPHGGKIFWDYTIFGEKMYFSEEGTLSTVGVILHEFGHDLGLPDLYNQTTNFNGLGLGYTNLMAYGGWNYQQGELAGETPVGLSAYSKEKLGVPVEVVNLEKDRIYDLKTMLTKDDSPNILRINTENSNEYFLIENRQYEGFDKGFYRPQIYSGGIAVYRINTDFSRNHRVGEQLVTLMEAEQNIVGYSKMDVNESWFGDPFYYVGTGNNKQPQATVIDKNSNPSTKLFDNSYGDFSIEVLDSPSTSMRVKISKNRPVEEIRFDFEEKELEIGQHLEASPLFTPENATNKNLAWESSDTAVATVDVNGKVTALKEGQATITATSQDGGKSASFKVQVVRPKIVIEEIVIDQSILRVAVNEQKAAPVSLVPTNAYKEELNWKVANTAIAESDEQGLITGKKQGQTTLTVATRDGKISKTVTILVGDDHGDTRETATEIEVGKAVDFNINYAWDSDYFTFIAPEAGQYVVAVQADNDRLASISGKDEKAGLKIKNGALSYDESTQTMYQVVTLSKGERVTEKLFCWSWNGTTVWGASFFKGETTGQVKIEKLSHGVSLAIDYQEFPLGEATPIQIKSTIPPQLPFNAYIYEAKNPEIMTIDAQGNITAHKEGRASFTVTHILTGSSTSKYVTFGTIDDHGDTKETATEIELGKAVDFNINYAWDSDYFTFIAPEAGQYVVTVQADNDRLASISGKDEKAGLKFKNSALSYDESTQTMYQVVTLSKGERVTEKLFCWSWNGTTVWGASFFKGETTGQVKIEKYTGN